MIRIYYSNPAGAFRAFRVRVLPAGAHVVHTRGATARGAHPQPTGRERGTSRCAAATPPRHFAAFCFNSPGFPRLLRGRNALVWADGGRGMHGASGTAQCSTVHREYSQESPRCPARLFAASVQARRGARRRPRAAVDGARVRSASEARGALGRPKAQGGRLITYPLLGY